MAGEDVTRSGDPVGPEGPRGPGGPGGPGDPSTTRLAELPLFPLPTPLFPGTPLPLHVFERRYRRLVADVRDAAPVHQHFGVVAVRGPVGMTTDATAADLWPVGTTARVLDVRAVGDGRFDLATVGSRRFRLRGLVQDSGRPYHVGRVEWIDHPLAPDEPERPDLVAAVSAAFDRYVDAVAGLQDLTVDDLELPTSGASLSWTVATVALLSNAERHDLLGTVGAVERLRVELALLRREIALVRATRTLPATDGMLDVDQSQS